MGNNRVDAVLKTLLYSDIFEYPLKKEEIWQYLISDKSLSTKAFNTGLDLLKKKNIIDSKGGYYFLRGKEINVLKRLERKSISAYKLIAAKKIIKKISFIPFIKFIGISGALSMENSDKNDDIDIFVIAEKKLVWTARFFLIVALISMGVYRRRNAKNFSDKICLNMVLDEGNVKFENANIYFAHEISQLIPITDKNNAYKKFIAANKWVTGLLPNVFDHKIHYSELKTGFLDILIIFFAKLLFMENMLRFLQLSYMKEHITKEEIREGFLGFHPYDYKAFVLKSYKKKIIKMGSNNKKIIRI